MEGDKVFLEVGQRGGSQNKQAEMKLLKRSCLRSQSRSLMRESRGALHAEPRNRSANTWNLLPWNFLNWIFMFALRVFSSTHQSWAETPEEIRLIFVCRHKQSRLRSAAQMPQTESASVFEWTGHTSCVSCLAPPTPERVNSLRKWRVQTSGCVG